MTTIVEKRREIDAVAWFLVLVLGFAAWRGAEGAPVIAAIMAFLAAGTLVAWLAWRRKPASMLTISPDEIFFGRLDQTGVLIVRDATGRLRIHEGVPGSGWFLELADTPDQPGISMIGFDLREVERACLGHGWTFG